MNRAIGVVRTSTGRALTVEPHRWVSVEGGRERAEAIQLPLRLGWAITVHKAQGMSLDAAVIDLRKAFMPGMGYVGLSRVRSLQGVYLTGLNSMAMRLHPEIVGFDHELHEASALLAASLPGKEAKCSLVRFVVRQDTSD